MWAWMGGSANAVSNIFGVAGASGAENASYTPGSRSNSSMWYDKHGLVDMVTQLLVL